MATTRTYLVSFNPAARTNWGGFTVTFNIGERSVVHEVEAASLPDLEREVRRLAIAYGRTCLPYVRLKDRSARKPSGFDAWDKTLTIIKVEPDAA